MLRYLLKAAACAALCSTPAYAVSSDSNINLVCTGHGQKMENREVSTLEWDHHGHKYKTRDSTELGMRDFSSAVTIQISGDDGRIRLSDQMIALLHSGGDKRWWQLKNIQIGDDKIKASYDMNLVNSPKVRIDRRTGEISIRGLGSDFDGICNPVDPGQKRF